MEFALTSEQLMLQESLKGFLSGALPLDTLKAVAAGDAAQRERIEQGLAEFGLTGLLAPESAGGLGLGLGLLDAVVVQDQLGYAAAPSNFTSTAIMTAAAPTLAADFVSGNARAAVTLQGLSTSSDAFVLGPADATHLLYVHGATTLRVTAWPGGEALNTIDRTRTVFKTSIRGDAKPIVSNGNPARVLAIARLLIAADTLGAAQAMLDKAVAYAAERKQFGRVIGSFQAVKHLCAEMAAKLEPSRALVWQAAYALDTNDPEALVMANLAKAHLSEVGTFIARTATEVHGGMGFTDLVGLHYWYKRIGLNRALFGSPEAARETAAHLQGFVSHDAPSKWHAH